MMGRRRDNEIYNVKRTGNYGIFSSKNSFPIEYLQTTFSIAQLSELTLAREVSPETLDFELLMQRDIDEERVRKKMVPYLNPEDEASSKATFFPPLLVAALPVENDTILKYYSDEIAETDNDEKLIREWPEFFKIDYYKNDSAAANVINYYDRNEKKTSNVDFHEVEMSFNLAQHSKGTKLVVIDGQHRLYSLREVAKLHPHVVKDLVVPVCILFPPHATVGLKNDKFPHVIQVFRHLFVDVNTTMELVGGHFNILLSDSSMGSLICRELCNEILSDDPNGSLHLATIEWNTKSKKDSTVIKKNYSITSIGVIEKALSETLGKGKYKAALKYLINHPSISEELSKLSEDGSADVAWDKYEHAQRELIKNQIKKLIVPAISQIFQKTKAFEQLSGYFYREFKRLERLSSEDTQIGLDASLVIKHLTQYVPLPDGDENPRKLLKQLEENVQTEKEKHNLELLTYAVFQRAILHGWVSIVDELRAQSCEIQDITELYVSILDKAFDNNLSLFDKHKPYVRHAIFGLQKIKPTNDTVAAITHLILSNLGNKEFANQIIAKYDLEDVKLEEFGYDRAAAYMERYKEERKKNFITTYAVNFETLDDEERENLRIAESKLKKQNADVRNGRLNKNDIKDEFTPLVEKHVKEDFEDAHASLKKALSFDSDIVNSVNPSGESDTDES